MPSFGLPSARAEASRLNGAKSRGPKTLEGKARSAQNALKHGLRAQKYMVLPDEDPAAFAALEAAIMEELAPESALQVVLARRVVAATWRLERAERLEVQLFAENHSTGRSIGLALIRDCNGARSFDTLLRYRGGTLAELWRALRTLKALQHEQAEAERIPAAPPEPSLPHETPIEPESRVNSGDSTPAPAVRTPAPDAVRPTFAAITPRQPAPGLPMPGARPIEPETRGKPAESAPRSVPVARAERGGSELLNGTALAPLGRRRA